MSGSPSSAPPAGGPDQQHGAYLAQGQFMLQRCGDCARHVFQPRTHCPHCGSAALDWTMPSGAGTVYAVTTVRRKPEAGGDFNVSIVELDEGVRLMSRVEGVAPADVRIGMAVRAKVVVDGDKGLLVFQPEEEAC